MKQTLLLISLTLSVIAQPVIEWEKTYGHGIGYQTSQSLDAGYIVTGGHGAFVMKIDEHGDSLWINYHGSVGLSIKPSYDNGYILTSSWQDFSFGFYYGENIMHKLTDIGDSLWNKQYSFPSWNAPIAWPLSDGSVITCTSDGSLIKIDSIGDILWISDLDEQASVSQLIKASDSTFMLSGEGFVMKIDTAGNEVWNHQFPITTGGQWTGGPSFVLPNPTGSYFFAGIHNNHIGIGEISPNQDTSWVHELAEIQLNTFFVGGPRPLSMELTLDGGFVLSYCDQQEVNDYRSVSHLIRYDRFGNILWTHETDVSEDVMINHVLALPDSTYIYSGAKMFQSQSQVYIMKTTMEVATSLDENDSPIHNFTLDQNYPNPFNPTTTISYLLPDQSTVKLTVFDIRGLEVMTLQDGAKPPGNYEVQWNGMDESGNPVSTGVYFARLQAGTLSQTVKMVYLR